MPATVFWRKMMRQWPPWRWLQFRWDSGHFLRLIPNPPVWERWDHTLLQLHVQGSQKCWGHCSEKRLEDMLDSEWILAIRGIVVGSMSEGCVCTSILVIFPPYLYIIHIRTSSELMGLFFLMFKPRSVFFGSLGIWREWQQVYLLSLNPTEIEDRVECKKFAGSWQWRWVGILDVICWIYRFRYELW